jgi:hypothetical protein
MAISRFKTSSVAQGLPKYQKFWDQSTQLGFTTEYLVLGGGGGGMGPNGGSGGNGGVTSNSTIFTSLSTNYTVTVGGGGNGTIWGGAASANGTNSVFGAINIAGGNRGSSQERPTAQSNSGQGGCGGYGSNAPTGYGEAGFSGYSSSITGSSVTRGGGGGGGGWDHSAGAGGSGGGGAGGGSIPGGPGSSGTAGATNYGGGGGGAGANSGGTPSGGNGGSGIVILKYPDTRTITIGSGLTGSTGAASGGYKVTTITAGTGNVSWV